VAFQGVEKTLEVLPQPERTNRLSVRFEGLKEKPGSGDRDGHRCREEEPSSRPAIEPAAAQRVSDREESRYQSRDRSLGQNAEAESHPRKAGGSDVVPSSQDVEEEEDGDQ